MKRKEREREILRELDEAVSKEKESVQGEPQVQKLHCKRCKSLMEGNRCPVCGYKIYTPMAEEKRKKIRTVVTVVSLAVFVLLFFWIMR